MSFDWRTEEDSDWDDQQWQQEPETAVSPSPPWRTIIIIVLLLAVAGSIVYQQVTKRLDDATTAVESDIFAAHNLLNRAASSQDGDLGKTVLSGRDMGWSQAQSNMLNAGLYQQNPVFGFAITNEEAAYAPLSREDDRFVSLDVDPTLSSAELQFGQEYQAFTEDGVQTVILQQTAVYRRGETRWLLSPPADDFWGEWVTQEQENITYVYPARDAEVLERLTTDLADLLADVCVFLPELDCETAVRLRFDTDPESLLDAADPAKLYQANLRLNLPTPSLVGLPISNAGYEALLYAYATKLVAALVADSIDYVCCSHAPLFQAVMIYQLSELGLAEWPVSVQKQQELVTSGVHTELIFPFWSSSEFAVLQDDNSLILFGFIDFLLEQYVPQLSPLDLMAQMEDSRVYRSWLVGLRDEDDSPQFGEIDVISRDWWFYAMTQAEATAVSQQPISLPAQDLQVGCTVDATTLDDNTQTSLYRYSLGNDLWTEEFSFNGLSFFNPLPQDNGVILQLIEFSETQYWQTMLWQNGIGTEVMNIADMYTISLGQMDPNGRFLLSYFGTEEQESLPEPQLIDVQSCLSGTCGITAITQTPYWSQDSQWMLLNDSHLFQTSQYVVDGRIISLNPGNVSQDGELWLRQASAEPETAVSIGEGSAPFWIDNVQFGYIRTTPETGQPFAQELVIASVDDLTPQLVLSTETLANALPERRSSNPLLMQYAIAHPADPNSLLLLVATQASDGYLLQLKLDSGDLEMLFPLDISRGEHSLGFSPDGRFLVATGAFWQESSQNQEDMLFGVLHLYDFASGEHKPILNNNEVFFPAFTFDWSKDGNWLAFSRDENVIGLLAPAYDYQQMIIHDEGGCFSLAWVDLLAED